MSSVPSETKSKPTRTLLMGVVVFAVFLTVACGTGVAAFAGLLPASEGVAVAVTATPLVDMQVAQSKRG
jgi:hypothetical protein